MPRFMGFPLVRDRVLEPDTVVLQKPSQLRECRKQSEMLSPECEDGPEKQPAKLDITQSLQ